MHNGVQEALVEDSSPGMVNQTDIVRAIADGKGDQEAREFMSRGFLTIDSEDTILRGDQDAWARPALASWWSPRTAPSGDSSPQRT